MDKQETPRQQKINRVLQQEIATLLQQAVREGSVKNLLVSVTKVHVTSDLSIAKIYLSIFPVNDAKTYIETLAENSSQLRHDLAQRMKNQLRRQEKRSVVSKAYYLQGWPTHTDQRLVGMHNKAARLLDVTTPSMMMLPMANY